ncbi:unnamed protein product [Ectocarpus sp. 13 AM-2016]
MTSRVTHPTCSADELLCHSCHYCCCRRWRNFSPKQRDDTDRGKHEEVGPCSWPPGNTSYTTPLFPANHVFCRRPPPPSLARSLARSLVRPPCGAIITRAR